MTVVRLGRRAMGTSFEVCLCGDDEASLRAVAEEALDLVDRLEAQMSLYLETSELCAINARAAFEEVSVEPRLFGLLQRARELHEETGGAFDIAIAPLMAAWGFRGAGARDAVGMHHVLFGENTIRFDRTGVALDLGGIGKGYAIDRVRELLEARGIGSAFLHGGASTIYAMGAPPGEAGWKIGLVDPREPDERLGSLLLRDRALSCSSGLGRLSAAGAGHVIDPRSGEPAKHACAWALGDSATSTDALSTAILVRGRGLAERYSALLLDDGLERFGVEVERFRQPRRGAGVSRRDFVKGTVAAAAAFGVGLRARPAAAQGKPAAREVKIAVIGLGDQGLELLRQLVRLKKLTVAAICDTRKQARDDGVKIAGRDVETYGDFAHLLEEEEIHAVVIATPTHLHAPVALAALEAGLHVFCEAPLAHTLEDCRKIARAATKSGRRFQVGHQRRCSRLYPHALSHIGSGAIGTILQIRAQWNRKQSWRRPGDRSRNWRLYRETSGGLLLEKGSHIFDLANWFLGKTPETVSGIGSLLRWKDGRDTDDSVQVVLRYPKGVQVTFGASLVNSYGDEREIIVGDAAAILCTRQHKGLLFKETDTVAAGWEQYAKTEMLGGYRGIILDAEATKYEKHTEAERLGPEADRADLYAELETFLTTVRDRKLASPCDAGAGLRAAVTAIVAAEAVAKGRVIEFTKEHFEP